MPIQRRESFGKRFFSGVRDAMPFIMQYLQNREQQANLDREFTQRQVGMHDFDITKGVGLSSGFGGDYQQFTKPPVAPFAGYGQNEPQGVDPNAIKNLLDMVNLQQKQVNLETAQTKLDKLKTPPARQTLGHLDAGISVGDYNDYVDNIKALNAKNAQFENFVEIPIVPYNEWAKGRQYDPLQGAGLEVITGRAKRTQPQSDQPLTPAEKAELERLRNAGK